MKAMLAMAAAALLLACGAPQAGGKEVPPKPVSVVQPAYPYEARKAGVEGMVTTQILVGADGAVREVTVLKSSGNTVLDSVALEAARTSTFEPGTRDGKPVEMNVTLPFNFRLDDGPKDKRGAAPEDLYRTGWPDGPQCRGAREQGLPWMEA
jgi:protein TonB